MAHCAKYVKVALGHMTKHYERARDENGEYVKFGNESIDLSRTHLNYNLAVHQQQPQLDFIKNRLDEVHVLKRKDINVMCSWVVTAPKELPEERNKEFFERSYRFLEERYGKENVISAYVHMDETTPHMHFAFVPVVYDKKKERFKVSAKEAVNRYDLQTFHKDLQSEMNDFMEQYDYEFECNVLNGATENGNLTIEEMKSEIVAELVEETVEQINQFSAELQNKHEELADLKAEHKELEEKKEHFEERVEQLEQIYNQRVAKLDKVKQNINFVQEELQKTMDSEGMFLRAFVNNPSIRPIYDDFCEQYRKRQAEKREQIRAESRKKDIPKKGLDEWRSIMEQQQSQSRNYESKPVEKNRGWENER